MYNTHVIINAGEWHMFHGTLMLITIDHNYIFVFKFTFNDSSLRSVSRWEWKFLGYNYS